MTREEQWLVAEAAAPVLAALPPGGRGSVTAWLGEHSASMTQHGHLDVERLEHGRWSLVAVVARAGEVSFWWAYDTVPTWWKQEWYSSPDLPEAAELAAPLPGFRPDWAELLGARCGPREFRSGTPDRPDEFSAGTSRPGPEHRVKTLDGR